METKHYTEYSFSCSHKLFTMDTRIHRTHEHIQNKTNFEKHTSCINHSLVRDTMLHGLMYKYQVQVCVLTSDSSNSYVQLHGATEKYSYFLIYQQ